MKEMSTGNFDVNPQASEKYVGDYKSITTAIRQLKSGLSASFLEICRGWKACRSDTYSDSGTSKESAAASEELSSQAAELKRLVDQFKLEQQ